MFQQNILNPRFTSDVLVTDEAVFTKWDPYTCPGYRKSAFDSIGSFSLNVWAGIVDDRLIGSFILPNLIDGF